MEDIPYYFSQDGSDPQGPVTKAALRQLFLDGEINTTYFFCQEGDPEWQPFTLQGLDESGVVVEEAPPMEETLPAKKEVLENLWSSWVEIMESTSVRMFCYALYLVMPLLLGFILTAHYVNSLPSSEPVENHMGDIASRFIGINAIVVLVMYLMGVPFPHAYRLWIRAGGLLILAIPVAVGWLH